MNAPLSLYLLANEYQEAAQRLGDLDLPDEVIRDTLEGLAGALEVKCQNVALFMRNLEATAEQIKQAEVAMANRRKSIETRAARLKAYLLENMERTGITKIESPHMQIAIRENPPAVVIDAESQIPDRFWKLPPQPMALPDRAAIAAAIKAGTEVPGCHLERGKRVEIK